MKTTKKKPRNHLEAVIALTLVDELGNRRIRQLMQTADHPAEVFTLPAETIQSIEGFGSAIASAIINFDSWNEVGEIRKRNTACNAEVITVFDENYPELLRQIYDPPALLWVKGDIKALSTDSVSIVGTRRATEYGKEQARYFTEKLNVNNFTVTSGLALGIDSIAHKTTLEGNGTTIAVLGSGIDVIYPYKHTGLAKEIIENGGAVITEFAPGTKPDAGNFPERNRIVSGLSLGTLVVESGLKGGSMITAQSALEQNREVFVVPHSLQNVNGIGCNHLIKRSAGKLVQDIDDMLEELPVFYQKTLGLKDSTTEKAHWKVLELDDVSVAICELLEEKPMHIDAIREALNMSSNQLSTKLLELEMQDCVRQKAGKRFELR